MSASPVITPKSFCFIPQQDELYEVAYILSVSDQGSNASTAITVTVRELSKATLMKIAIDNRDFLNTDSWIEEYAGEEKVITAADISKLVPITSFKEMCYPPSDLIKLIQVDRASILHALSLRFGEDRCYTSIGPILVAVNPFKWMLDVYSESVQESYKRGQQNLSEQPHVFAIAQEAYGDLTLNRSQSIVISGESGAGKTEATKQCLNQLAHIAGSSTGVQEKLLRASPILEAWGNAKTLRNNNSSRFGKFIEVWLESPSHRDLTRSTIVGASNTTYILEKSRVCMQETGERNYHVFYQFLRGANAEMLSECKLGQVAADPTICRYLSQSGCVDIDDVDDATDHRVTLTSYSEMGFSEQEVRLLYRAAAGVLHLGNIVFRTHPLKSEESDISQESALWLRNAAEMLGVDPTQLLQALLFKKITVAGGAGAGALAAKKAAAVSAAYRPAVAEEIKNAAAKEIYSRCFDCIVARINQLMLAAAAASSSSSSKTSAAAAAPPSLSSSSSSRIGVLDIFGFEIFPRNSFEQLCINLANEALQQHFNVHIFQIEMQTYRLEDVPVPALTFVDNQDVLDLISKRPRGLISILDEEGVVPKGSWEGFLKKFCRQHADHPRFKAVSVGAKASGSAKQLAAGAAGAGAGSGKAAGQRNSQCEFGILHYAGEVYYDAQQFLLKNKDTLAQDIVELLSASSNPLVRELFREDYGAAAAAAAAGGGGGFSPKRGAESPVKRPGGPAGSSADSNSKLTVGKKFTQQLEGLITTLNSTQPRYIRCIKPNQQKRPGLIASRLVEEQLTYSGVFEAVVIMQNGYPFRLPHAEFRAQFHMLVSGRQVDKRVLFVDPAPTRPGPPAERGKDRPFSREQCQVMVTLIVQCTGHSELRRCFVGKTKTFWQSAEQRLLTSLKHKTTQAASVAIQRVLRGRYCRRLLALILAAERSCVAAVEQRRPDEMLRRAAEVEQLAGQLATAFGALLSSDAPPAAKTFAAAMALETQLCVALTSSLSRPPMQLIGAYDEIDAIVQTVLSRGITTVHVAGRSFTVDYRDNAALVQGMDRVAAVAVSVRLKQQLDEGIRAKNELLLEKVLLRLDEERRKGDLVLDFSAFQAEAEKIISVAAGSLMACVSDMMRALKAGKTALVRSAEGAAVLDVSVDPGPLVALLAERAKYSSSKRVDLLFDLSAHVADLRLLLQQRRWDQVWLNLRSHWQALCTADGTIVADENDAVLREMAAEVQTVRLAALHFHLLPMVAASLRTSGVPTRPVFRQLFHPTLLIDVDPLAAALTYVAEHSEYFDAATTQLVACSGQHLRLRQAVNGGSAALIARCLQEECPLLPPSDADRVNAAKFVQLERGFEGLLGAMREGRPGGEPGALLWDSLSPAPLQRALEVAAAIEVAAEDTDDCWPRCLAVAAFVLDVRTLLTSEIAQQTADYPRSMEKIEAFSREIEQAYSDMAGAGAGAGVASCVQAAAEELSVFRREIEHSRAIVHLLRAVSLTRVSGQVGALDFSAVDQVDVAREVESCWRSGSLVRTARSEQLAQEISRLLGLRRRARLPDCDWPALARQIRELGQGSASSQWMQAELTLLLDESCDVELRALLEGCALGDDPAAQYAVLEGGGTDFAVLRPRIDLTAMQTAMQYGQRVKTMSEASKQVLLAAQLLFCLRRAVQERAWEPRQRFPLGGCDADEVLAAVGSGCIDTDDADAVHHTVCAYAAAWAADDRPDRDLLMRRIQAAAAAAAETVPVTVMEAFQFYNAANYAEDFALRSCFAREFESLRRMALDRTSRLLLILATASGSVGGGADGLELGALDLRALEEALSFHRTHTRSEGACSSRTTAWAVTAASIADVRAAILRSQQGSASLFDLDQDKDLLSALPAAVEAAASAAAFARAELAAVWAFMENLRCTKRLLRSLARSGQCVFDPAQQRFDRAAIHCGFVQECLRAAEALPGLGLGRSAALERAVAVGRWTCRLRAAVQSDLWAVSPRGDLLDGGGGGGQQLVDDILEEFDAAHFTALATVSYLASSLSALQDEVGAVQVEVEKRRFVVRFREAFHGGSVCGRPFGLSFRADSDSAAGSTMAMTMTLQEAVAAADQWPHSLGCPNSVISQLVKLAVFVMRVRSEIAQEHSLSATPGLTCPAEIAGSADLTCIVSHLNIAAVIQRTCDTVDSQLTDRAQHTRVLKELSGFWHSMHSFVEAHEAELSSSSVFFVAAEELADVSRDGAEKMLVLDGRLLLSDCAALGLVAAAHADRAARLASCRELLRDYRLRRQKLGEPLAEAWSAATYPGAVIIASIAVLGNLLSALLASSYDSLERSWLESAAVESAPSLQALLARLHPDLDPDLDDVAGNFSMQRTLCAARKVAAAVPEHSEVRRLRAALERQLQDRVSIREMNVALSDPNMQSRERSGQPFVPDSSVAYSRSVLARMDEVGLFRHFDSEQVFQSFRLLTALRAALHAKDLAAMHAIVAQHVCDGRTDLEAALRAVASGCVPSVVPAAKTEFAFLANFAHNSLFCESVKSALLNTRDAVSGTRGALTYSTIAWAALDSAAALSAYLSPLSADSERLVALTAEVSSMRRQTLGRHDLAGLQEVQRLASRIGEQVRGLAHWPDLCAAVLRELDLVDAHCAFLITREALKVEVLHPSVVFDARGLTVDLTRQEVLAAAIDAARAQQWHPDLSAAEEEASRLLTYAVCLLKLLRLVGAGEDGIGLGSRCLLPGSAPFSAAVALLQDIQLQGAVHAEAVCGEVQLALREHDLLLLFDDLTARYQVTARQDRERSRLAVEEAHSAAAPWDATRAVALTSVEGWTAADDFPRFARATLDSAASCSGRVALTWVGKARLDLASKLTLFRLAVYGQKWTDAKHLADELRQQEAHRWGPELDSFSLFLEQWTACRYLEFALSSCSLPATVGWTLASNVQELVSNIDLTYLQRIYATIRASPTELSLPHYSALRDAYRCVSELDGLAERCLPLCCAAKEGRWLSESDLGMGMGQVDHNLSMDIFQIASALRGNIVTGQADPTVGQDGTLPSVYTCTCAMKSALLTIGQGAVPEPLQRRLSKVAAQAESELRVILSEFLIRQKLSEVLLSGRPGQLIIPKHAPQILKQVLDLLEQVDPTLLGSRAALRSGWLSVRALAKLLKAHLVGDLSAYAKALEVMVTLSEQQPFSAAIAEGAGQGVQVRRDFPWRDVWRMDDAQFSSLCSPTTTTTTSSPAPAPARSGSEAGKPKAAKGDSLRSLMRSRRQSLAAPLSGTGDTPNPNPNPNLGDNGEEEPILRHVLNKAADGEPSFLREEVRATLPLLQDHYVFEAAYSEFITAIQCTPAAGQPGDLKVEALDTRFLVETARLLRTSAAALTCPSGRLLLESAQSLAQVRSALGQVDARAVSEAGSGSHAAEQALAACRATQRLESAFHDAERDVFRTVSLFGCVEKRFIQLAAGELDLIEQHLQQLRTMRLLAAGLLSPGILALPLPWHPDPAAFEDCHWAIVETRDLENACMACDPATLTCHRAKVLLRAAEILLALRRFVLARGWGEMGSYLEGLRDLDLSMFSDEDLPHVCTEVAQAGQVRAVCAALQAAAEAFLDGALTYLPTEDPDPTQPVHCDTLRSAAAAFAAVEQAGWLTADLTGHKLAVQALLEVRSAFLREDYAAMHRASSAALAAAVFSGDPDPAQGDGDCDPDLVPVAVRWPDRCGAELSLARDHAAFVLSCSQLCDAIYAHRIEGEVGKLQLSNASVGPLHAAIRFSRELGYDHEEVRQLQDSAEGLFFLRRAVLLGNWISQDLSREQEEGLGRYFQLRLSQDPDSLEALTERHPDRTAQLYDLTFPSSKVFTSFEVKKMSCTREKKVTVRTVINTIAYMRKRGRFIGEIEAELDLVEQECLYREIVAELIANIYSQGFQGVAGRVDASSVAASLPPLERCVALTEDSKRLRHCGVVRWLLRDAKVLLKARSCRLHEDWPGLQQVIDVAERYNREGTGTLSSWNTAASHPNPNLETEKDEAAQSDKIGHSPKLLPRVFQEIRLLRADALFNLCLSRFAHEMMKDENMYVGGTAGEQQPGEGLGLGLGLGLGDPQVHHVHVHAARADEMKTIMQFSEECSAEFDRLLEAQRLALELRVFHRDQPHKSPQDIIHRIAAIKKRDLRQGDCCYVTMLICDIAKMQNVLDFPVQLAIVQRELSLGQRYLASPVGLLDPKEISVEVLQSAFQAATPSLEIMGSEENHVFMKMVAAMISLRTALSASEPDLRAAMHVIISHEALLRQFPSVEPELLRVRIELENQDAVKQIEAGLTNGRYLDVVSVAKMVQKFDRWKSFYHPVGDKDNKESEVEGGVGVEMEGRDRGRGGVALGSVDAAADQSSLRLTHSIASEESAVLRADSAEVRVAQRRNTMRFLSFVTSSVSVLARSAAVTEKILVKSSITQYYLETAHLVLRLRECIVGNRWDQVRAIVMREDLDLPATAMEEINAVKEGLTYQDQVGLLASCIVTDCVVGLPHRVDLTHASTERLSLAIEECEGKRLRDQSAAAIVSLSAKLLEIRRSFLLFCRTGSGSSPVPREGEDEEGGGEEDSPKIQEEEAAAKEAVRKRVLSAVEDYLQFFVRANEIFRNTFQIPDDMDYLQRKEAAAPCASSLSRSASNGEGSAASASASVLDWTHEVYLSVCCACEEVKLVSSHMTFRNVRQAIVRSLLVAPDCLRPFLTTTTGQPDLLQQLQQLQTELSGPGPADQTEEVPYLSSTDLEAYLGSESGDSLSTESSPLAAEELFFDSRSHSGEAPGAGAGAGYGVDGQQLDRAAAGEFHIGVLRRALIVISEYLEYFEESTRPEEILALADICKVLISFRKVLCSQLSADDMLKIVKSLTLGDGGPGKANQAARAGAWSGAGAGELEVYVTTTCLYAQLRGLLLKCVVAGRVAGHINDVTHSSIARSHSERLREIIAKCERFIRLCGPTLSLGLSAHVDEAGVLLDLRQAVVQRNWAAVSAALGRPSPAPAALRGIWRVVKQESDFIASARDFHLLDRQLSAFVSAFDPAPPVRTMTFQHLQTDLRRAQEISRALQAACHQADQAIGEEYFSQEHVLSFQLLLRALTAAVERKLFYDKKKMHVCAGQVVSRRVDRFLFDFFGLADIDFPLRSGGPSEGGRMSIDADETLFSVLISVDFGSFPANIRRFLSHLRCAVVDHYLRDDLTYFMTKGRATVDPDLGNVVISELFLRFLELVLSDVAKVSALAAALAVPMRFCQSTWQLIRFAQQLHACRSALVAADGRRLAACLSKSNQLSRIALFGAALPFERQPDTESDSESENESKNEEVSLQLALDHSEEIEIFQSFSMAKMTELQLRAAVDAVDLSRLATNGDRAGAGAGAGAAPLTLSPFRTWLQQSALAEKQLVRILPYHRDVSAAAQSFLECVDATRQGDFVRFQRAAATLRPRLLASLCGEDESSRVLDYLAAECSRDRPDLAGRSRVRSALDDASFTKKLFALLRPMRGENLTLSTAPSLTLTRLRLLKPTATTGQVRAELQTLLSHSLENSRDSLRNPLWVIALAIIVHLLWVGSDCEVRSPPLEEGEGEGERAVVIVSHRLRSFLQRLVLTDSRQPDLLALIEVLTDIARTRTRTTRTGERRSGPNRASEQGRLGSLHSMDLDFSSPKMLEDVISHVGNLLLSEEEEQDGQVRLPLSRTLLQALHVDKK